MIAFFGRSKTFNYSLKCRPSNLFIHVKKVEDLVGRTFTAIIEERGWYEESDNETRDAYSLLRSRSPELSKELFI